MLNRCCSLVLTLSHAWSTRDADTTAYEINVLEYSPIIAEPKKLLDARGITTNIKWNRAVPIKTFGILALSTVAPPTSSEAAA